MPKSVYIDINESTPEVANLIRSILLFVDFWVRSEKTPVPKKEIVQEMKAKGKSELQVNHALTLCMKHHYIRKAISVSNRISFVQTATVSHLC